MKKFGSIVAGLLSTDQGSRESAPRREIIRAWDRERARAMTPTHRAEIDAIFSRYI